MRKCYTCGRSDVRLYREYGMFLRDTDIKCNAHIRQNSQDWIVPLIEAPDGTVWGYTSCPEEDIKTWRNKPDADPKGPKWSAAGWYRTPRERRFIARRHSGKCRRYAMRIGW